MCVENGNKISHSDGTWKLLSAKIDLSCCRSLSNKLYLEMSRTVKICSPFSSIDTFIYWLKIAKAVNFVGVWWKQNGKKHEIIQIYQKDRNPNTNRFQRFVFYWFNLTVKLAACMANWTSVGCFIYIPLQPII